MDTTAPYEPSVQVILGIPFNNVTFPEAVEWVHRRVVSGTPGYIATANLDFVKLAWEDPELQRILLEADLVVADGFPIVWLSRLFGPVLKERVTGSDLVPMLAEMAAGKGHSLYLLGGAPGVGEKAADSLRKRFPGVRIAGQYSPPLADVISMDHSSILGQLKAANPDILLIAFGAPKQEKFANLHVREWSIPVSIGVGGTLDFLAGTQIRAPRIVQKLALEWLWRMMTAPRRLARRYWADLLFLMSTCWRLLTLRLAPDRQAAAGDHGMCDGKEVCWAPYTAEPEGVASLFAMAASRSIALDLRGISWLSSTELGTLLQLAKACRLSRHRLVLVHPGSRVRKLLSTCRLSAYMDLAGSPAEVPAFLTNLSAGGQLCRTRGDQLLIEVPRELTAANVTEFRASIEPELNRKPIVPNWVVDLASTHFIDSSALGLFAAWRKQADRDGANLTLVNARDTVAQTFRIAKREAWLAPGEK